MGMYCCRKIMDDRTCAELVVLITFVVALVGE